MKHKTLLLANLLRAETASDRELQYTLLQAMAEAIAAGEELDRDAFALLVEDHVTGRAISTRRAARLVQETGAFLLRNGCWVYGATPVDGDSPLAWEDFVALFQTECTAAMPPEGTVRRNVDEAIRSAVGWIIDMTLKAIQSGQIDGQPAFYTCEEDGDHIIGFRVAGTATSDSLTMLCAQVEDLPYCGKKPEEIHACVTFLLEKVLACQCAAEGWDLGGFYPLEDQPESQHPTVDATCLAVMALCDFLEKRDALEDFTREPFAAADHEIMNAVLRGLEFLFRIQQAEGSFTIYRFENGSERQANENCTRIAQSTMGVCKGCGIFDKLGREDLYPQCSHVIAKTFAYFSNHAALQEGRCLFAPYFGEKISDFRTADVLVSTARVGRSFIPVWWQMEAERPRIISYWRALADFWSDHEKEAAEEVGFYRFSTPTESTFSSGEYTWASHPDMLAGFTLLQAHNLFSFQLSERNWALIEGAVSHILSMQHPHGHWDNPLAQKTPFCAVTLAAIELLQEYREAKCTKTKE